MKIFINLAIAGIISAAGISYANACVISSDYKSCTSECDKLIPVLKQLCYVGSIHKDETKQPHH